MTLFPQIFSLENDEPDKRQLMTKSLLDEEIDIEKTALYQVIGGRLSKITFIERSGKIIDSQGEIRYM